MQTEKQKLPQALMAVLQYSSNSLWPFIFLTQIWWIKLLCYTIYCFGQYIFKQFCHAGLVQVIRVLDQRNTHNKSNKKLFTSTWISQNSIGMLKTTSIIQYRKQSGFYREQHENRTNNGYLQNINFPETIHLNAFDVIWLVYVR